VQALGVRAEDGENVAEDIEAVVKEACQHFAAIKTSDPQENLSAFTARLKLTAEVTHASQAQFKETLLHAANACPTKI
jgi:hypothetical protein